MCSYGRLYDLKHANAIYYNFYTPNCLLNEVTKWQRCCSYEHMMSLRPEIPIKVATYSFPASLWLIFNRTRYVQKHMKVLRIFECGAFLLRYSTVSPCSNAPTAWGLSNLFQHNSEQNGKLRTRQKGCGRIWRNWICRARSQRCAGLCWRIMIHGQLGTRFSYPLVNK